MINIFTYKFQENKLRITVIPRYTLWNNEKQIISNFL